MTSVGASYAYFPTALPESPVHSSKLEATSCSNAYFPTTQNHCIGVSAHAHGIGVISVPVSVSVAVAVADAVSVPYSMSKKHVLGNSVQFG